MNDLVEHLGYEYVATYTWVSLDKMSHLPYKYHGCVWGIDLELPKCPDYYE